MTLLGADAFAHLASGSLPALGTGGAQSSWSRSLNELKAVNEAFLGGRPQQPTAGANSLLGAPPDFGRLAASLQPPKVAETGACLSVEQMLRQHRDEIMLGILHKERERTRRKAEALVAKHLQEDWQNEKARWLKETVGARTLGGSGNASLPLQLESNISSYPQLTAGPTPYRGVAMGGPSLSTLRDGLVQEHLTVVKSISSSSSIPDLVAKLQKRQASSSAQESCYSDACQLLSCMIPRYTSAIDGAVGALVHFCKQFQRLVTNRVHMASLAGQDVSTPQNYGSGMATAVAAYVKVEFGASASVWHVLYFALRCGDAVAAKHALNAVATQHDSALEGPVRNSISLLAQRQSNASCLWESGSPNLPSQDRQSLLDLYERTNSVEHESIYKLGTIALLCGSRPLPTSEARGFSTIEDYMFGWLWRAVQQNSPLDEIAKLGEIIRSFGPDYFGNEESGGWSYALPLLASQQFKTAFSYLADAGGPMGLLQATHLGIILSLANVPVTDIGENAQTECVVTALLVAYASRLEMESVVGVQASLEYLLQIPSTERMIKEIAALTARNYTKTNLAGVVSPEGGRQNAILDERLPQNEVSIVLAGAAEIFRKEPYERSKALASALLYMLAGRYSSVLGLLNELMAPPEMQDEERVFWCQQSDVFRTTYLLGRSLVSEAIERENNISFVSTNLTLMGLRRFFALLHDGSIEQAWEQLTQLELLPRSQEDMSAKLSQYNALDPVLKTSFPAILKGAMGCLHSHHRKAKSGAHEMNSVAHAQLRNLQETARLLVTFGGQANLSREMHESVARLEAEMI